nr:unnamed protein product [Callosobruchus chinensis]
MNACSALALLGKITQLDSSYQQNKIRFNEKVRKNRYILKRIISCIKFCSALRGRDESTKSSNRGIFRELLDFSAELDDTLREHLQNASVLKGSSKAIQNDILDCMLSCCKYEMSSRIKNSDFLAIQCDETSDISNWCQLVLICRYVYDGTVCEHFWCFKKVTDKTAEGLRRSIEEELDFLITETPEKLIAQSYDGANGMSGVHQQLREKYPYAHYVHCYAHELNVIIEKAASQHAQVRLFFNNLSAIPAFFSNSSNRSDDLKEIVKQILPKIAVTKWTYNIRTANTVYENREQLIEVFEEIEQKCLKRSTTNEASGLRRALEDPEFIFWLTFFHRIIPHVEVLYNQIQSRNTDDVQLHRDIETFETCVAYVKSETEDIQNDTEKSYAAAKRRREESSRSVYAKEVCNVIVAQIKDRFSFRGHLQAEELFVTESFEEFSKDFPANVLDAVCAAYPFLCQSRLKTELEVIYSRSDFRHVIGAMNFLSLMLQNDLSEVFPETIKLLKIILTTPMTTAEAERCFSTLKSAKSFLRSTMDSERLNALAMMNINESLAQDIQNFEDKVMEKFICMKDRRADFTFKK